MEINSWDSDDDIIKQMNFLSERGADHLSPRVRLLTVCFKQLSKVKHASLPVYLWDFSLGHNSKAWWI